MELCRSFFSHAGLLLPETERLAARLVSLPSGTSLGAAEIQTICGFIRFIFGHGPEIQRELLKRQPPKA
jgi:dTDP-4-amino-4,6-dideoxygalactose transaminase